VLGSGASRSSWLFSIFLSLLFIVSTPENGDILSLLTEHIRHFCAAILSVESGHLGEK
jgi:hypothetical protein